MKIAIFGAGSIGAFVGGSLRAAGSNVVLIGRAKMGERIRRQGLLLTDLQGRKIVLTPSDIAYAEDPAAIADADLILVTVKSADTADAAGTIQSHARSTALVISLQNGIGNAANLRKTLTGMTVIGAMVPFNVVQMGEGRLHRGTEGELTVEQNPALDRWQAAFAAAHLPLLQSADFAAVQWGKLLLNLNNPVNALSDLPLKTELSQRAYRRCLALLIEEARLVLHTASITPAKVARVAPNFLPLLLRLPDPIFKRVAAAMLRIDPEARSSMWEDLQAGRRTEVDFLNGAVVALAESFGINAPANRRIVALIRDAENGKHARISGEQLYATLRDAH